MKSSRNIKDHGALTTSDQLLLCNSKPISSFHIQIIPPLTISHFHYSSHFGVLLSIPCVRRLGTCHDHTSLLPIRRLTTVNRNRISPQSQVKIHFLRRSFCCHSLRSPTRNNNYAEPSQTRAFINVSATSLVECRRPKNTFPNGSPSGGIVWVSIFPIASLRVLLAVEISSFSDLTVTLC
jgi:hypothetical protein